MRVLGLLWCAAITVCLTGGAAVAKDRPQAAFMPLGDMASAPAGFVQMCERDTVLCHAGEARRMPARMIPANAARSDAAAFPKFLTHAGLTVEPGATPASLLGHVAHCASRQDDRSGVTRLPSYGLSEACLTSPVIQADTPAFAPTASAFDNVAARALIGRVDRQVNNAVRQVNDVRATGETDRWNRLGFEKRPIGDCEDIAIEKRMRLMDAGFPAQRLFLAVAYKYGAGLHTVLIARLDDGDYVLDSLASKVKHWSRVRYQWLRVQTPGDPLAWRVLDQGRPFAAPAIADNGDAGQNGRSGA